MSTLPPFEHLYEGTTTQAVDVPLPPALAAAYGHLRFRSSARRPYVIGNFVTTLDGVVSLNIPGKAGGGEISGFNQHDRMLMGLLRAVSDAVIVGAGTLRSVPKHVWTPAFVFPSFADNYAELRRSLTKQETPLNVIVTQRGELDLQLPVFQAGNVPVLVVTTEEGARHISSSQVPSWVQVRAVRRSGPVRSQEVLAAVAEARRCDVILVEGGPRLMGDFFAERCLDELFLTLSPQVAGRNDESDRPGLVSGRVFAPQNPLWGTLAGVSLGGSHLFLRYTFT